MTKPADVYVERAARLAAEVSRELAQVKSASLQEDRYDNAYHLADANLRHFFPAFDARQRREVLADVFFLQRMANVDQNDFLLANTTPLRDPHGLLGPQAGGGRIFCTYHVGSYRHLIHFLAKAGIDCLLFAAGGTLGRQGDSYMQTSKGLNAIGWPGTLELVDANAPSSLLYAMRALKRGKSVIIYIDGNSGVGANRDSGSLRSVPFLGKQILVRSGVAYLSHLSGAPIVPVVCTRDAGHRLGMTVHAPIRPQGQPREEYAQQATQVLYRLLEDVVAARPGQWEGWLYVEKFMQREGAGPRELAPVPLPQAGQAVVADVDRFALLRYGPQPVLLDKQRHSFLMLDEAAATLFANAAQPDGVVADAAADVPLRYLMALEALRSA
jgi:lauroyl/myristoyl acyltransferase